MQGGKGVEGREGMRRKGEEEWEGRRKKGKGVEGSPVSICKFFLQ